MLAPDIHKYIVLVKMEHFYYWKQNSNIREMHMPISAIPLFVITCFLSAIQYSHFGCKQIKDIENVRFF